MSNVDHPAHYNVKGKKECIDEMVDDFGLEMAISFCLTNAYKYLYRAGTYDAKIKVFTFSDNVNMFTDSIFVKTTRLTYDTERGFATFGYGTNAWKEDELYKRVVFQGIDEAIAYMNKSRIPKADIIKLDTVKDGTWVSPMEIVELIYYEEEKT